MKKTDYNACECCHKKGNGCSVLIGACKPDSCKFRKTQAEFDEGRRKAVKRIRQLPPHVRDYIYGTYKLAKKFEDVVK